MTNIRYPCSVETINHTKQKLKYNQSINRAIKGFLFDAYCYKEK